MIHDMSPLSHVRPTLTLLAFLVLVAGLAYPGALTGFAHYITPASADGSLLRSGNGTVIGSSLLGQNVTCAYENLSTCPYRALLWLRPSPADYEAFTVANHTGGPGTEEPYGPTDPVLYNETLYYMHLYGTYNVTVDLVTPSASGLDPDVTPEAALVQVPRVAHFANLSQSVLTTLVGEYEETPLFGYVGPSYVNVLELDIALLQLEGGRT